MLVTKNALVAALACSALTAAASAGTSSVSIVNGASHGNVDLTVTVQASSRAGYDYDFVVSNTSGAPGASVTGIYFQSGWSSLISSGAFSGSGTLGSGSSAASGIAGWGTSAASYTVGTTTTYTYVNRRGWVATGTADNVAAGIQEGNSGIVSFNSSASLADLEAALGTSGFNVGVKIQDVVSDIYSAGWGLAQAIQAPDKIVIEDPGQGGGQGGGGEQGGGDTPIAHAPTPTAAAAGLVLMGLAGLRRRRA